jgi:hypothetical protein
MKFNLNLKRFFNLKLLIIIFLVIILFLGFFFAYKYISIQRKNYEKLLSDIEYIYYFIKVEPKNIDLYGKISEGDGVSRSIWENYLSTSDNQLKNLMELITFNKEKMTKYHETSLLLDLEKSINIYKNIKIESKKRVENDKTFTKEKLDSLNKDLQTLLNKIKEESKKYKNIDLR